MIQGESESRLTEADLSQFTGTSQWYTHPLGLMYTDGVQYLAEQGGAYWLLDAIALTHPLYQQNLEPRAVGETVGNE